MLHGRSECSQHHSATDNGDDKPGFGLPVRFELRGKRTIGELLELAAADELGEPSSPDALEVSWARAPQRLVNLWMTRRKGVRQVAPLPN